MIGQYFTVKPTWIYPQVSNFIKETYPSMITDPFAGKGHMLSAVQSVISCPVSGMDIDPSLGWQLNDSLKSLPVYGRDILCLTNPPYFASNSATRKKNSKVSEYFKDNNREDLYQIALDRCIESFERVVAIIPESFVLSGYTKKFVKSITILENNPFTNTDCPVCIVCFDKLYGGRVEVYKNESFVMYLDELLELVPSGTGEMTFNAPDGNIGLEACDSTGTRVIRFCLASEIDSEIKVSSRHKTIINVPAAKGKEIEIVEKCNHILNSYRILSSDCLMAAFKGNTKTGKRRRRLDFKTARGMICHALNTPPTCPRFSLPLCHPLQSLDGSASNDRC